MVHLNWPIITVCGMPSGAAKIKIAFFHLLTNFFTSRFMMGRLMVSLSPMMAAAVVVVAVVEMIRKRLMM